jgi:hypothetical protein
MRPCCWSCCWRRWWPLCWLGPGGALLIHLLLPVLLVLQVVFFILSEQFGGSPGKSSGLPTYIASLHVVNGLLIFGLAGFLALRVRSLPTRQGETVPTRPTPETVA